MTNNYQPEKGVSSNFLLDIVSSKEFKIAALVILLVAGLTALTVGSLGIAGVITALTGAAAIGVTAAGGAALGVTSSLAIRGFFVSQPQPSTHELENDYFVGVKI